MLGFESDKIQIALDRIAAAEILARQFSKKARRRNWHNHQKSNNTKYNNAAEQESASQEPIISVSFEDISVPNNSSKKKPKTPDIQYELLATNCMLMSSTIQFLRNSWLEYMKAAYKLRKAYKLYEQMFESLTGQKASEYASSLKRSARANTTKRKQNNNTAPEEQQQQQQQSLTSLLANSPQVRASWNEKRLSLFYASTNRKTSFESIPTTKRRPMSSIDLYSIENMSSSDSSITAIENAIESGVFFGIGLFSLIFSLLPPRGNSIYSPIIDFKSNTLIVMGSFYSK
jgi:hypothetical protein